MSPKSPEPLPALGCEVPAPAPDPRRPGSGCPGPDGPLSGCSAPEAELPEVREAFELLTSTDSVAPPEPMVPIESKSRASAPEPEPEPEPPEVEPASAPPADAPEPEAGSFLSVTDELPWLISPISPRSRPGDAAPPE